MSLLRPIRQQGPPLFRFDAGWLFLVAGAALLCATVLLPAFDDLTEAENSRDAALALEAYQSQRLANHAAYMQAIDSRDETLLLHLAATQLNLVPTDRDVLLAPAVGPVTSASPFQRLDAEYVAPVERASPNSLLHALATNDTTRLWLIAGGALAVLYGLLPITARTPRRETAVTAH